MMRKIIITSGGIALLFTLVYNVDVKAQFIEDPAYVDYLVEEVTNPDPALDYSQEEIYLNYLANAVVGSKVSSIDFSRKDQFENYLVQILDQD